MESGRTVYKTTTPTGGYASKGTRHSLRDHNRDSGRQGEREQGARTHAHAKRLLKQGKESLILVAVKISPETWKDQAPQIDTSIVRDRVCA